MCSIESSPRFICDVHLGRLARLLRLLGFDTTVYGNYPGDQGMIHAAASEGRIFLARGGRQFARLADVWRLRIRSEIPVEQVREVIVAFGLRDRMHPFSRCTVCNGALLLVDRSEVPDRVPIRVHESTEDFRRCPVCLRVYWPGSHYDRMKRLVDGFSKGQNGRKRE